MKDNRKRRLVKRMNRWVRMMSEQYGICPICHEGMVGGYEGTNFDHIIPLSKGGEKGMRNIQLTHSACNFSRGSVLMKDL